MSGAAPGKGRGGDRGGKGGGGGGGGGKGAYVRRGSTTSTSISTVCLSQSIDRSIDPRPTPPHTHTPTPTGGNGNGGGNSGGGGKKKGKKGPDPLKQDYATSAISEGTRIAFTQQLNQFREDPSKVGWMVRACMWGGRACIRGRVLMCVLMGWSGVGSAGGIGMGVY